MAPVVSIGTQSFEKLRRDRAFYVDKTGLIREWRENQDDVKTCRTESFAADQQGSAADV